MSAYKTIEEKIRKLRPGSIVSLDQFVDFGSRTAIATALTRLTKSQVIIRLRRGMYMKPKQSKFGPLPPSKDEMLAAITNRGKKSYSAGLSAYNEMGLTSQVPNSYILRGGRSDLKFVLGGTNINIKAGKSPKFKSDIPLLMILDSIREIRLIPDSTLAETIQILRNKILILDKNAKIRLVDLSLKDKPFVRAFVGAVIDECNPEITFRLSKSLNPLTTYKIGKTGLKFANDWKIK